MSLNKILTMDSFQLFKEGKKLRKEVATSEAFKLAILGSSSIQLIADGMRTAFSLIGKSVDIYESSYQGILSSTLLSSSEYYAFQADMTIILPDVSDLIEIPFAPNDEFVQTEWINNQVEQWNRIWDSILSDDKNQVIIQANYVIPIHRSLGQMESSVPYSETSLIRRLNEEILNRKPVNVSIVDFDYIAGNVGKKKWFDPQSFYLSKAPFHIDCYPDVIFELASAIQNSLQASKKVLVLDLDNTLWGGVIGDEGYEGINLDPNDAIGEAYRSFQRYILKLYNQGILLAVCSKNDEDIARSSFKNKYMILQESMFASFKANWNPKSDNLKEIANELNLGIDSLVFFDDNPFERNIVEKMIPEVMVIDVPEDPSYYVNALDSSLAFNRQSMTHEDLTRNSSYAENKVRESMKEQYDTYDDYLKSLKMTYKVLNVTDKNKDRFTQLTNKSNQFNLRTQRYQSHDISIRLVDEKYRLVGIELNDVLSHYGMIACIILHKQDNVCFIENWVMSCRVLKRGVEDITMNEIVIQARDMGCDIIRGEYLPSGRNAMVETLLDDYGFVRYGDFMECDAREYSLINTNIRRDK